MQRSLDIVETGINIKIKGAVSHFSAVIDHVFRAFFVILDATTKEVLIAEKLTELETAIEQRKSEIRNFLPIVPMIGFATKDLPQNFQMEAQVLTADDSDTNDDDNDDDDQSVADMMDELEESVESSPLSERV